MSTAYLAKPVIITNNIPGTETPEGLHVFRYTSQSIVLQLRGKPKKREQAMAINLSRQEARTLAEQLNKLADELD